MAVPNRSISPTLIDQGRELYQVKDAMAYTGLSNTSILARLKRWNEENPEDHLEPVNFGGREKYYTKEDLEKLLSPR